MLSSLKFFFRGRFFRSVFAIVSGSALAQLITITFMPLITRLYSPDTFGAAGSFVAILGVLSPMAALTYPLAIVMPKNELDAECLVKISILCAAIVSVIVGAVLFKFSEPISELLSAEDISGLLPLIAIAMFFVAVHQSLEQWAIRNLQFKLCARTAVCQSLTLNSAKAAIGYFYASPVVLITITAFSSGLYAVLLYFGGLTTPFKNGGFLKSPERIRKICKTYQDFAIYRAPEVTINAVAESLPVLMLAFFFGTAAAGYYALSRTVMAAPISLIGKAVGDVFYPRIVTLANESCALFGTWGRATMALSLIGILPFGLVFIFGPWVFSFVFSEEWRDSGKFARWLSVWLYFNFMAIPSIKVIPLLGAQKMLLFHTAISLLIRLLSFCLGYYLFGDMLMAVILFSVASAFTGLALILLTMNACRSNDLDFI